MRIGRGLQSLSQLLPPSPQPLPDGRGSDSGRHTTRRGFTFIEMMVVISIILLLLTMAIPIFQKTIVRAKESVLKNNLTTIRTVIDNYSFDKMKAPQSLQDLVSEGYLKEVPIDPMTGSNSTWKIVMEDASQALNQSEPGIFDVHSGSDKTSLDGTPYSDW
jgi:general secretion pathway protein G